MWAGLFFAMVNDVSTSAAVKKRENKWTKQNILCDSSALRQTKQKAQQTVSLFLIS